MLRTRDVEDRVGAIGFAAGMRERRWRVGHDCCHARLFGGGQDNKDKGRKECKGGGHAL